MLLVNDEKATQPQGNGSEDVFRLLTELSDDFMAEGRQQPPLQARDELFLQTRTAERGSAA